jgi:alpha-beta hydrolase superfamily lysophospholipase
MLCKTKVPLNWKEIKPGTQVANFSSVVKKQQIYVKKHQFQSNSTMTLFLFHDLASYHGRYSKLTEWFKTHHPEINLVMMDYVGHGLSSGTRGHLSTITDAVFDMLTLFDSMEKEADEKWMVLGHGLGALAMLDLLNRVESSLKLKIDGLILSNFVLNLENPAMMLQNQFYDRLTGPAREAMEHLRLTEVYEVQHLLSHKHDQMLLLEDPLIIQKPTFGAMRVIHEKVRGIYQDAYFLDKPLLILQGQSPYVHRRGMESFAKGLKKNILTQKNYANLKHDLYNESVSHLVFSDIAQWVRT